MLQLDTRISALGRYQGICFKQIPKYQLGACRYPGICLRPFKANTWMSPHSCDLLCAHTGLRKYTSGLSLTPGHLLYENKKISVASISAICFREICTSSKKIPACIYGSSRCLGQIVGYLILIDNLIILSGK